MKPIALERWSSATCNGQSPYGSTDEECLEGIREQSFQSPQTELMGPAFPLTQLLTTIWRAGKVTPSPAPVRNLVNTMSHLLVLAAAGVSIVHKLQLHTPT